MMISTAQRLFVLLQACLMWTVSKADASFCTKDQEYRCKTAAIEGTLDYLPQGGICKPSTYVSYTHVCSVSNYLPPPEFCCCADARRVFCCRYHYDWNQFRCDESQDIIHVLADQAVAKTAVKSTLGQNKNSSKLPLPLEILIPAIVVPSLALLCFTFYCIKCCCCNDEDDDDDDNACNLISKCRKRRRNRKREKSSPLRGSNAYAIPQDSQRSSLLSPSLKDFQSKTSSEKCDPYIDMKYPSLDPSSRIQPSAPPVPPYEQNDSCINDLPPPYNQEPDNNLNIYERVLLSSRTTAVAGMPYIQCLNEKGDNVIYQPIMTTNVKLPLPVTEIVQQGSAEQEVIREKAKVCEKDSDSDSS